MDQIVLEIVFLWAKKMHIIVQQLTYSMINGNDYSQMRAGDSFCFWILEICWDSFLVTENC